MRYSASNRPILFGDVVTVGRGKRLWIVTSVNVFSREVEVSRMRATRTVMASNLAPTDQTTSVTSVA